MIVDFIDPKDVETLRACALAGSALRPRAQKALFTDVTINPNRLQRMNECFISNQHLASYPRRLSITTGSGLIQRGHGLTPRCVRLLLDDVCLLSRQGCAESDSSSLISSLRIYDAELPSIRDLLQILSSFPHLSDIALSNVSWESEGRDIDQRTLKYFHRRIGLLRLSRLSIRMVVPSHILSVLYAPEAQVCLEHIELDSAMTTSEWPSLVRRAGKHLRTLIIRVSFPGGG